MDSHTRISPFYAAIQRPAPQGPEETILVPLPARAERPLEQGILSRGTLLEQAAAARAAIAMHAPVAYLDQRYGDDLAVIWIGAHPDTMGAAQIRAAHAHVLGMLMGEGDAAFTQSVPRKVTAEQILYVGLTETTPFETDFIERHGISRLSPEELSGSSERVLAWLHARGATKVAVHFDLDVLDPALTDFLLFNDPDLPAGAFEGVARGRMQFAEVAAILQAVATEADIVGLAITEYLPWSAISLAEALRRLPLLGDGSGARALW